MLTIWPEPWYAPIPSGLGSQALARCWQVRQLSVAPVAVISFQIDELSWHVRRLHPNAGCTNGIMAFDTIFLLWLVSRPLCLISYRYRSLESSWLWLDDFSSIEVPLKISPPKLLWQLVWAWRGALFGRELGRVVFNPVVFDALLELARLQGAERHTPERHRMFDDLGEHNIHVCVPLWVQVVDIARDSEKSTNQHV